MCLLFITVVLTVLVFSLQNLGDTWFLKSSGCGGGLTDSVQCSQRVECCESTSDCCVHLMSKTDSPGSEVVGVCVCVCVRMCVCEV
jgi:hypothetical protein